MFGPRLPENRLAHKTGKRADRTPLQAKLPERCTETLDPRLSVKNDATFAWLKPLAENRELAPRR
jgi:hypothetical protein